MTILPPRRRGAMRTIAIVAVLAVLVAGFLWWVLRTADAKKYSAVFDGVVGLYEDNDVRVLGVKVGTVDAVIPQGDTVRVEMSVDPDVRIPAGANAVIVAPSLVSDRYVQFTPAYAGGPELAGGTILPRERTSTPLEVDDLYASLNRVSTTLGPNGVNKNGALSDLLNTLAANTEGNGQAINDTVTQLSQLSSTLSGNSEDLFATVDNLQRFTSTLADSDAAVHEFSQRVAGVTGFLADERANLAATVNQLGIALGMVQKFIDDNRGRIKSNVDKLAGVTQVLVDQRAALAEVLDVAPLALSNIINSYNGSSGTLDSRSNLNELTEPPIVLVCNLVRQLSPSQLPPLLADTCDSLTPVVQGLVPLPSVAEVLVALQQGKLPPLPLPLAGTVYGTPGAIR
ncbi:MAG TPA: MCE family protein [Actinophytocola sp.]|uniref:MCE family protein n=1 Tax=Actinophytocola sp. TaxID=1872138 RepID=UPI002DBD2EA6|nr:MCE family protein [Actinophytocola sp.]HEU5469580.1 MCE family protein [Actinophytocola sp.]